LWRASNDEDLAINGATDPAVGGTSISSTRRARSDGGSYSEAVSSSEGSDWTLDQCQRIEELIDEYRVALHDSLRDLTEEEARRLLVPSKTTLLGLVKHASFVEGVWFDQAVTGRSYDEIGIPRTVDGSFSLRKGDTIEAVQAEYRKRWETSRTNLAGRPASEIVDGRGARPVWALHLQVLRELAQHTGHADILREQVLADRSLARPGQQS
jgi:hypothetical protein